MWILKNYEEKELSFLVWIKTRHSEGFWMKPLIASFQHCIDYNTVMETRFS